MNILVTYDVATVDEGGPARLRRVAKICEAHGQRVQNSVFECTLSQAQYEQLVHRLEQMIEETWDSLRFYRLPPNREEAVQVLGKPLQYEIEEPLVV